MILSPVDLNPAGDGEFLAHDAIMKHPTSMRSRSATLRRVTEVPSRRRQLIELALTFGAALAWLLTLDLLTPAHEDTARNLLMAADCLADDVCLLSGPTSSFLRLKQGGVFVELLAGASALGLSTGWLMGLLGSLFAASTVMLVWATRRAVDDATAWGAGAFWLIVGVWAFHFPIVDLPVALPLPLGVAWAGALAMLRGGSLRGAFLMGLGGAVALAAHLVVGLWLLGLAPFVVLAASRPARALLVFAATMLAVTVLTSIDALLYDLAVVDDLGVIWPLVGIGLLTVGAAVPLRGAWARLEPRTRLVALTAVLGPGYVATLLALGLVLDKEVTPQFWAPAIGPLALVAGALLVRGVPSARARVACLVVALAGCHVFAEEIIDVDRAPVDEHTWSLADAERAGKWLFSGELAYQDLFGRLQGPNATLLLSAVAPYESQRVCRPAGDVDDLLVVRTRGANVEGVDLGAATILPLGGSDVAVFRPLRSWLRREALVTCVEPHDAPQARRCGETPLDGSHVTGCEGVGWAGRSYPHVPAISRQLLEGTDAATTPVRVTFSIPIRPAGDGTARQVRLATPTCDDACCWRIQSVEGLPHDALPETDGFMVRAAGAATGVLHLSRVYGGDCEHQLPHFPPDLVELRPDEGSLRALLGMRAD